MKRYFIHIVYQAIEFIWNGTFFRTISRLKHFLDENRQVSMNIVRRIANTFKSDPQLFHRKIEHEWIFSHSELAQSFKLLEAYISQSSKALEVFNSTFFLSVKGSYASAIDSGEKFILVYPELITLLKSSTQTHQGVAILAHELGHLVLNHQQRKTNNLIAQIEADLFAHEIGLGRYLLEFLESQSQGLQVQKRVQALKKVIRIES